MTGNVTTSIEVAPGELSETLSAVRVVKSFAMEEHETARFSRNSWEAFRSIMRGARVRAVLAPIVADLPPRLRLRAWPPGGGQPAEWEVPGR